MYRGCQGVKGFMLETETVDEDPCPNQYLRPKEPVTKAVRRSRQGKPKQMLEPSCDKDAP